VLHDETIRPIDKFYVNERCKELDDRSCECTDVWCFQNIPWEMHLVSQQAVIINDVDLLIGQLERGSICRLLRELPEI